METDVESLSMATRRAGERVALTLAPWFCLLWPLLQSGGSVRPRWPSTCCECRGGSNETAGPFLTLPVPSTHDSLPDKDHFTTPALISS
jgi:hypothetical protein